MIGVYLKRVVKFLDLYQKSAPKHPHFSRSVVKDNEIVSVDSFDETPFDEVKPVPYVGFSTYVETGEQPPTMGGFSAQITRLSEQRVAEIFLEQFNAMERQKQMKAQSAQQAVQAPQPEPQPAAQQAAQPQ